MLEKYTISNIVNTLSNKENFKNDDSTKLLSCNTKILILFLIIYVILFWWAIILLITKWKYLPDWAKIFSIFTLINQNIGGPAATLIIIYIVTDSKKTIGSYL